MVLRRAPDTFFSPQLILQRGSNVFISKKTIIFQDSRGIHPYFPREGVHPNFTRGCPIAYSYRNLL